MLQRASETAEDSVRPKTRQLNYPARGQRRKLLNKCERTCVNDGVTFIETTRTLLESRKEKRGRKGQRLYLKKQ